MRTDTRKRIVRGIIGMLTIVLIAELVIIYQLGWRLQPPQPEVPAELLIQAQEPTALMAAEPVFPTTTPYPVEEEMLSTEPPPLNEFMEPPMLELGILELE